MIENNLITTEEWRPIPGYEEHYEVSDQGRVRRIKAIAGAVVGRILKPHVIRGYLTHRLSKENKLKGFCVHTLVAAVFIGPRPDGYQINHIDGIKTNNAHSNLEYITPKENQQHASRLGLLSMGDRHYSRKHPERRAYGDRNGSRKHPEKLARGDRHGSKTHPESVPRGDRSGSRLHPESRPRGDLHSSRTHPEKLKRGSASLNAKINEEMVIKIRTDFLNGLATSMQLAKEFGLHLSTIRRIIRREIWKHVA